MANSTSPRRPRLAIAIDFGTSFSGISYKAQSTPYPRSPETFKNWPVSNSTDRPAASEFHKVPTYIAYPKDPVSNLPILWGFQAERLVSLDYIICKTFKLDLHGPNDSVSFSRDSERAQFPEGKTAQQVASDYLNLLYTHFEETMSSTEYSRAHYDYDVVFTIPATFSSDNTRDNYEAIVQNTAVRRNSTSANPITVTVGTLTEPEAAGAHAIFSESRQDFEKLSVEDGFVVCDAGGGTVDVCSYTVKDVTNYPYYNFEQAAVAEAKYCGSALIDDAFLNLLLRSIGKEKITNPNSPVTDSDLHLVRHRFIELKEEFKDVETRPTQYLKLPASFDGMLTYSNDAEEAEPELLHLSRGSGELGITRSQMRSFFSRSVAQTKQLLTAHIEEVTTRSLDKHKGGIDKQSLPIKYIYLVGGLGTSVYLQSALEDAFKYQRIRVITPPNAEIAVSNGAARIAHRWLHNDTIVDPISAKLLPYSYGIVLSETSNKDKRIYWVMKRGERYYSNTRKPVATCQIRRQFKKRSEFKDKIVKSRLDPHELPETMPESGCVDSKVFEAGYLTTDFRIFGKEEFPRLEGGVNWRDTLRGKKHYEATFVVVMRIEEGKAIFASVYHGQEAGLSLAISCDQEILELEAPLT